MYVYTITAEDKDGIRDFDVRCYSEDIVFALDAMWRDVRDDEFGLLEENGIEYQSYNEVTSNYNDGFVSYSVISVSEAIEYMEWKKGK